MQRRYSQTLLQEPCRCMFYRFREDRRAASLLEGLEYLYRGQVAALDVLLLLKAEISLI